MPQSRLSAFETIKLQIEYAVPLLKDLEDYLGRETLEKALAHRNVKLRERAKARSSGPRDVSLEAITRDFGIYSEGGTLEYEVTEEGDAVRVDVTSCAFATMMQDLEASHYGPYLLCSVDYAIADQAGTKLTRTETLMQGAKRCNFCFTSGLKAKKA